MSDDTVAKVVLDDTRTDDTVASDNATAEDVTENKQQTSHEQGTDNNKTVFLIV